jgi:hypothetical protein
MSFVARTSKSFAAAMVLIAGSAQAQTAQTPQGAPAQPAAAQQAQPAPPTVVAGIPVNYDESKVGTYTLPDPLVTTKGRASATRRRGRACAGPRSCG